MRRSKLSAVRDLDLWRVGERDERVDVERVADKNIPLITTFTAKETVFTHFIELQGNVQTKQNVLIYPEMPGILKTVFVKKGQQVVK